MAYTAKEIAEIINTSNKINFLYKKIGLYKKEIKNFENMTDNFEKECLGFVRNSIFEKAETHSLYSEISKIPTQIKNNSNRARRQGYEYNANEKCHQYKQLCNELIEQVKEKVEDQVQTYYDHCCIKENLLKHPVYEAMDHWKEFETVSKKYPGVLDDALNNLASLYVKTSDSFKKASNNLHYGYEKSMFAYQNVISEDEACPRGKKFTENFLILTCPNFGVKTKPENFATSVK